MNRTIISKLNLFFGMKKMILFFLILLLYSFGYSQLVISVSTTPNEICNGIECEYEGPSILINEVMLSPNSGNGSIYGHHRNETNQGEWIELYNPNKCKPVDISYYFLGNNAPDGNDKGDYGNYGGGFLIPAGTIIHPRGFCVIRGENAAMVQTDLLVENGGHTVEIIVGAPNVCIGDGVRLWFPDAGGWFAFYNREGVPQDAISWANTQDSTCVGCVPCTPQGSPFFSGTLASYKNIPNHLKNYISKLPANQFFGKSLRRAQDGSFWDIDNPTDPTMGDCNRTCVSPPIMTCTGTATLTVSGGKPPYTFSWDDPQWQSGATATQLCEGTYTVVVKDVDGRTEIVTVHIENRQIPITMLIPDVLCLDNPPVTVEVTPEGGTLSGEAGLFGNMFIPAQAGAGKHAISYTVVDSVMCASIYTDTITVVEVLAEITIDKDILCHGDLANITASGIGGFEPYSYIWNDDPLFNTANMNGTSIGTYSVHVTDNYGCESETAITITQPEKLLLTIEKDDEICYKDCNGYAKSIVEGGTLPYSYLWSNGNISANAENLCKGDMSLTVKDANHCEITAQFSINSKMFVEADFEFAPLTEKVPAEIFFTYTGTIVPNYHWQFGNGFNSTLQNPVTTYQSQGHYVIKLSVNTGEPYFCKDEVTKQIHILPPDESLFYIPNSFTPNGDGINDFFYVVSEDIVSEQMFIYNRWKTLICTWNYVGGKWDGKNYKGILCPPGVYSYIYEAKSLDGKKHLKKGSVTLVR